MKAIAHHPRRCRASSRPSISLFPFLAVLICTMGALVPLLLAITRTARLQAESAALAKASEANSQAQMEQEKVTWRIEQLKKSRQTTESQLADARLELGHIEDHARRLGAQLARYKQTIDEFQQLGAADSRQRSNVTEELKQTQAQIAVAERDLAETRRTAAERKRSYSIVPYEGPNQTHRRPIYLECRGDAVVLWPEGIELVDSDFEGPLGPGNPLAALLRAAREYMLAQREFDARAGEPYPLLLVRPEGIAAYYAARVAMKSWGFDFGYELIDDDWKLSYPPADPRLAGVLRQVVAGARAEQARWIAAAPREYHQRANTASAGAPNGGGFVAESAPSGGDDPGYRRQSSAGAVGRKFGSGSGGSNAVGGRGSYVGDAPYAGSGPYVAGSPGGVSAGGGMPGGDVVANAGSGVPGGMVAGAAGNPGVSNGSSAGVSSVGGPGVGGGIGGSNATTHAAGTAQGGAVNPYEVTADGGGGSVGQGGGPSSGGRPGDGPVFPNGGVATTGGSAQNGSGGAAAASGSTANTGGASQAVGNATSGGSLSGAYAQAAGPTGRAAGQMPPDAKASATSNAAETPEGYVAGQPAREQPAAGVPQQSAGEARIAQLPRPGQWEPTPDPPPEKPKKPQDEKDKDRDRLGKKRDKDLVDKRGEDWALRNPASGAVGVTRPIHVACYRDRLVVVSERGPAYNTEIAVGPRMASSVNPFISAIWEQMDGWGIAGRGMYWRPVLEVEVAQDAPQRFAELESLLTGSGLNVVRR